MNQIARGIVLTVQALKEVHPDAVMVHVEATGHVIAEDESLEARAQLDMDRHLIALDLIQGRAGGDDAISSYLGAHGFTDADFEWYRSNAIGIEVLGLNYYPMLSLQRRFIDSSSAAREQYIWGGGEYLARIVRAHHERYGCPIFITETSANEKCAREYGFVTSEDDPPPDYLRRRWLDESVATVGQLIAEGIPIEGYTWWPLYDLINWDYRKGEAPVEDFIEPMGLFSLRMDDALELRRDPLPIASYMRRHIEKGVPSGDAGSTGPASPLQL